MAKHKTPDNEDFAQTEALFEEMIDNSDSCAAAPAEASSDAKLAEEVAEWQDKYLRLSAEFDNFRKRTLREKMGLIDSASEDVMKAILPIIDDMERAQEANAKNEDIAAMKEGDILIYKKLQSTLAQKGLSEIEAIGQPFETDLHEAVARIPVEDGTQRGRIIDVTEKGYKLKDKVIRFAKVVVGE